MNERTVQSPRLRDAGFLHGFSTRRGGASEGEFASLNLGRAVGDVPEHVIENHRRLAEAVGYDGAKLFERTQVHGAHVCEVHAGDDPARVREGQSDALFTRERGIAVGVRVADCVPVLVGDRASGRVAAIHAGWRGVTSNVVGATIEALGGGTDAMIAAIGPSIGPCCFEVGDDVAQQIAEAAGDGLVLRRAPQKPHVDLWRAVEMQLFRAGIRTVDTLGQCTVCDREQWFSYRRDGARSGRMLAVIVGR